MLPDQVARYVRGTGPDHDSVQAEMADYADEHGFPVIGPDAGAVLRLLARLTDADRVFEFGSGYGYSAYWFLLGGADHVVLTEVDADELDMAREFLARGPFLEREGGDRDLAAAATFELGDAVSTVEGYDGPFDVVLIDHQKHRYAEGFDAVREKVAEGGVVVADNMLRGPIDMDALADYFADGTALPEDADEDTHGVAEYVDRVRADEAFESFVLPVGSGLCVSTRVEPRSGGDGGV